ncbi:TetR/AcrR family transcriptional regulator [Mycobacterium hubeiense]|uniref:TetR/AcrR family transcriptional regulator n=1 Tax=Mycobacterium hubeiense TaxID=1867256 RepID=UPI000C7F379C|nr:TetR/AcrR family transcriptional regulator [Mycobacterium sp. QGD 101]
MASPRGSGRPLSVDDWVQAGFAELADGGPNALRIGRLCERLNVTKGSFYWHFADMQAYRTALVDAWGELRDRDRRRFLTLHDTDPRERLTVMMATLVRPQHWPVERVMRMWALTDERVAASVRRSDGRVLRAAVMFSTGVGLLHASDPGQEAPAELRDEFLDFMLRP